jgi:transposase-like protein
MNQAARERKEQQRQYIERLLESDLSVVEWCRRYDVPKQSMYLWLATFAEREPELFGGEQNIVDRSRRRWVESTRLNMRAGKQLAPPVKTPLRAPSIILVDSLLENSIDSGAKRTKSPLPITIDYREAHISVPAGSAPDDITAILTAVSGL